MKNGLPVAVGDFLLYVHRRTAFGDTAVRAVGVHTIKRDSTRMTWSADSIALMTFIDICYFNKKSSAATSHPSF